MKCCMVYEIIDITTATCISTQVISSNPFYNNYDACGIGSLQQPHYKTARL